MVAIRKAARAGRGALYMRTPATTKSFNQESE